MLIMWNYCVCLCSLLLQLFPSRCSIPVTQLQTGPVVLLVQICSQPPLLSSHQCDSEGDVTGVSWKSWKSFRIGLNSRGKRPYLPLLLIGPTDSMCSLWSLSSEYILLLCGQFWMKEYACINTVDSDSSAVLYKMNILLTTLQAFVSESHRETSQWRWTSS